jgi:hypothetical protein
MASGRGTPIKMRAFEGHAYEIAPVRGMPMGDTPWDGLCEKHVYERCVYEMAAYKRHAYEMAPVRSRFMRDTPMGLGVHLFQACISYRYASLTGIHLL